MAFIAFLGHGIMVYIACILFLELAAEVKYIFKHVISFFFPQVHPEGKFVVDIDKSIDMAEVS